MSKLLVNFYYLQTLHNEVCLYLSTFRQEYWVIKGICLVNQCINQCNNCLRYPATTCNKKIGILSAF